MKHLVVAALVAGQLVPIFQPARAATFDRIETLETRAGAFAGARLRIPLGGPIRSKPRVGLVLAPLVQSRAVDGSGVTRFGEGADLRLSSAGPSLSLGGLPVAGRLAAVEEDEPKKKSSTGKKVLKGAAVVAIVALAVVGGGLLALTVACSDNRCSE